MTNASMHGALADLPAVWRKRADVLRRHGAAEAAATAETLAEELADALRAALSEAVSLEDAARESGYSADHLSRLVRSGAIPNAGRKNAPAIRRADLPRKAGTLPPPVLGATSRAQVARSVVDSIRGHDDD